jgi:hypothetical protein
VVQTGVQLLTGFLLTLPYQSGRRFEGQAPPSAVPPTPPIRRAATGSMFAADASMALLGAAHTVDAAADRGLRVWRYCLRAQAISRIGWIGRDRCFACQGMWDARRS